MRKVFLFLVLLFCDLCVSFTESDPRPAKRRRLDDEVSDDASSLVSCDEHPEQFRVMAEDDEDCRPWTPEPVDFDQLKNRQKRSFVPAKDEFMLHDFPKELPKKTSQTDRAKSVCNCDFLSEVT